MSVFSFLNNLFYLNNSFAQARLRFARLNLQTLAYALMNVVAIVVIWASSSEAGVYAILFIQCFYLALVNLFLTKRRFFNYQLVRAASYARLRDYYRYAGAIFVTNLLGILLYSGDVMLLDLYLPDNELAIYLLAATAIKFLWLAIDSMGLVMYPELVQPSHDTSITASVNKLFVLMAALLGAALLVFYFSGNSLLNFVYGRDYAGLHKLIILFIIATYGVVFYKFLSRYFAAVRNWTPVYVSLITGIVADVVLIYLLVPRYGIIGAGYACVASYLLTGFVIGGWYFAGLKKMKPAI